MAATIHHVAGCSAARWRCQACQHHAPTPASTSAAPTALALPAPTCGGAKIEIPGALPCDDLVGIALQALRADVPALLDAYQIPYTFSDPLVMSLTLHKGMTKRVIRDLGIPTPDFAVVEDETEAGKVDLPFPLFAKPVAEGTGKGISGSSRIESRADLARICVELLRDFEQPVLVETYLPGREFTVGVTGTGKEASALAVIEVILKSDAESNAYSYVNKQRFEELVEYRLVKDSMAEKAAGVAVAAYKGLGCRDAGRVDLRSDIHGQPQFMEINPLAGLHPEDSDLPILNRLAGFTYLDLIDQIISSARARMGR